MSNSWRACEDTMNQLLRRRDELAKELFSGPLPMNLEKHAEYLGVLADLRRCIDVVESCVYSGMRVKIEDRFGHTDVMVRATLRGKHRDYTVNMMLATLCGLGYENMVRIHRLEEETPDRVIRVESMEGLLMGEIMPDGVFVYRRSRSLHTALIWCYATAYHEADFLGKMPYTIKHVLNVEMMLLKAIVFFGENGQTLNGPFRGVLEEMRVPLSAAHGLWEVAVKLAPVYTRMDFKDFLNLSTIPSKRDTSNATGVLLHSGLFLVEF